MGEKILYYDCFSGISGDMNLGAMIDIGVPKGYIITELEKLALSGYELRVTRDERKGISGTRADVHLLLHEDGTSGGAEFRTFRDISGIIERSSLSPAVKKIALSIFTKIAVAEGKIHSKPVDDVHFHEVGAVDSIIDIVGSALCIDYLKPDKIISSTVELGGGFVKCEHGLLPVPAPATAEILKGIPVKSGIVPFETTTPTGAAILSACVNSFSDDKRFTIKKIGYGIGSRKMEIPNVLRVFLGERPLENVFERGVLIECNVDDMNPELYGYISDKLFEAGAADVYFSSIVMKKSRPAVKISVLSSLEREQTLSRIILNETTTIGVRRFTFEKEILNREMRTVSTSLGDVRIKTAFSEGRPAKIKPEYEDCRKIAMEKDIPLREVYDIIMKEMG